MALSEKVRSEARKFALKNASDYGKAKSGAVLNKVLAADPKLRKDIRELALLVNKVVSEVNSLSKGELQAAFAPYASEFEQKARETAERTAKPKMEIEGAVPGKVVTRFPPEPGGYIQIGNAKQCILSDEIARIYDGKIYLYFDDTNPEKVKQEYVDGIKVDTEWLGIRFAREYHASDYIEKVYDAGRKLLKQGDAYVCFCDDEVIKRNRAAKKECTHRKQSKEKNLEFFEEMLKGKYEEGKAIVRLMGEMNSANATFRDPTIFRIKKAAHYRQGNKYSVWPTYHINTPVIDNINGVTDVIRDTNYAIWDEINRKLLRSLGLKPPRMEYQARLEIKGTITSKRFIRKFIKEGAVTGWDDPRLPTIIALRRRGIQPQAIRNFVLRFGMSKTNSVVPMEMLLAENKKIIDPIARHLFFVDSPIRFSVEGAEKAHVKLKLHPTGAGGFREYDTDRVFYIAGEDAKALSKGDSVRLKDLLRARVVSKDKSGMVAKLEAQADDGKIVQWVSAENYVECTLLVPGDLIDEKGNVVEESLKTKKGYVESYAKKLEEREIVQFERVGYSTLDDKKGLRFIFISA